MSGQAPKTRVVALISGRGSNLQAIVDQTQAGALPIELCAVISNRPDAGGLARAEAAGIATAVVDHTQYADRAAYDAALQATIDRFQPDLVLLAGFMRILTPEFVDHYAGRMMNIHPSLLPKYRGLHTHERALEAGEREHGATVHFVSAELDGGPAIIQARVLVEAGDTPDRLAARVLQQEHRIYPKAVEWFAQGRLRLTAEGLFLDTQELTTPVQYNETRELS